jgi:hypothetical protein
MPVLPARRNNMGFDLTGKSPRESTGKELHFSSWGWRPLWNYVFATCFDIIGPDAAARGHFNDGCLIGKDVAEAIAFRLRVALSTGAVREYEKMYKGMQTNIPSEQCDLCKGTGKRKDVEVENGCNGCEGTGRRRPSVCGYPFKEEWVQEFVVFCETSGGFEIG